MKTIDLTKEFWSVLSSRQEWCKSFDLLIKSYFWDNQKLLITITEPKVVTPSYLDETIINLSRTYPSLVIIDSSIPKHIKSTLQFLSDTQKVELTFW